MNEIDALLGLGMEGPDQTQALADSLRGRKRAADMFSLSTVGNIAKGAQAEQASVMEGAKRGGVLKNALADRQAKKDEAELRRQTIIDEGDLDRTARFDINQANIAGSLAEQELQYPSGGSGKLTNLDQRIDPETGQPVTIGQDRSGQWHIQGQADIIDPTFFDEALSAGQIQKGLKDIEPMLADSRGLVEAINARTEGYRPYSTEGETPTEYDDIPGTGYISGKKGTLGEGMRLYEQVIGGGGAETGTLFGLTSAIVNTKVRKGAGLSQTITEIKNIDNELGSNLYVDPEVTQGMVDRLAETMERELATKWSTIDPQVRRVYLQQLEELKMTNPFDFKAERLEFPTGEGQQEASLERAAAREEKRAALAAEKAALQAEIEAG